MIVPTWHDDCRPAPDVLIRALRLAGERGAGLVGLYLGAFPLAQAGLLDGLRATTHWAYADLLAERHPRIRVEREALYVDEGRVLTSAGVAAGLDCCLHLLGRLGGVGAASRAARRLVVAPHRDGGQAQFIEQPMPASAGEGRLARVLGRRACARTAYHRLAGRTRGHEPAQFHPSFPAGHGDIAEAMAAGAAPGAGARDA